MRTKYWIVAILVATILLSVTTTATVGIPAADYFLVSLMSTISGSIFVGVLFGCSTIICSLKSDSAYLP